MVKCWYKDNYQNMTFLQRADVALAAARAALETLGPLPHVLHATWKTRIDLFHNENELISHGLCGFAKANPGPWVAHCGVER